MGTPELLARMNPWGAKASWAVWDEDDITFPEAPSGLHTAVVVLAFNKPHEGEVPDEQAWLNFHASRRHHDHFLAAALRGTQCWGGYLTTLQSPPDETLADELRTLAAADPLVVLLGGKARDLFLNGIDTVAEVLGSTAEELRWVDVPHHSAMASRMHGNDPQRYAQLVDWSLQHPRTVRPWTLPGAPGR